MTAMLLVTLIAGCAAGVNFKKMSESQLVLGKTTKQEVLLSMEKSNGKGTNTFNGVELEIVNYAYAKVGGGAALPGVTPARSQGLLFRDGVLVGKEYSSSFSEDSTLFDTEIAKSITKGQTKEALKAGKNWLADLSSDGNQLLFMTRSNINKTIFTLH